MKKTLIALSIAALLSCPAFANEFIAEPESDTAVSYAAYDILSGEWETTFVNYCNSNGNDEYWLRIAFRGRNEKVLHYCTLYVDGESFRLQAVPIDDKHYYAAQSVTMNQGKPGMWGDPARLMVSAPRYYAISPDIAMKLLGAKKISINVDRVNRINTNLQVNNKMLDDIHKAYGLRYADFSEYWKPKDSGQKGELV